MSQFFYKSQIFCKSNLLYMIFKIWSNCYNKFIALLKVILTFTLYLFFSLAYLYSSFVYM